jgi:transposase
MFVDYAGTTLAVIDGLTGEAMTAQLFVAVLGASSLTYAEATWTQIWRLASQMRTDRRRSTGCETSERCRMHE